jgi:hypothetical protein
MASSIDSTVPLPYELPPLPETLNHTPWPAQNFIHVDPAGDAFHVLVCRSTYSLLGMQHDDLRVPEPMLLPPEQQPDLVTEDQHRALLNASSTVQESDFAPYKPLCDVLLVNARAWSPGGKHAARWNVGLRFGQSFSKVLTITGPRRYELGIATAGQLRLTEPEPTTQVPLCYELAYGGPNLVDAYTAAAPGEQLPELYRANPIGCGRWGGRDTRAWIEQALQTQRKAQATFGRDTRDKTELQTHNIDEQLRYRGPQIELPERPFKAEERDYPALGFGPTGRWWRARQALAGTHDERWKQTQWPKSPKDHDYRYWNCAPEDQQVPYPQGGEEIVLVNLTPPLSSSGPSDASQTVRFALPALPLKALVRLQAGPLLLMPLHIDTVLIDMASATLAVVRRVLIPADLGVRKLELGQWADESVAIAVNGATPHSPELV